LEYRSVAKRRAYGSAAREAWLAWTVGADVRPL